MKIRIYPAPKGEYKEVLIDTDEIPCSFVAQNGTVFVEFAEENAQPKANEVRPKNVVQQLNG